MCCGSSFNLCVGTHVDTHGMCMLCRRMLSYKATYHGVLDARTTQASIYITSKVVYIGVHDFQDVKYTSLAFSFLPSLVYLAHLLSGPLSYGKEGDGRVAHNPNKKGL
jgi:hypothetical protein